MFSIYTTSAPEGGPDLNRRLPHAFLSSRRTPASVPALCGRSVWSTIVWEIKNFAAVTAAQRSQTFSAGANCRIRSEAPRGVRSLTLLFAGTEWS